MYPWWQGFGQNRALRVFSSCSHYSCGTPRCLLYEYYPLSSDLTDLLGPLPPHYGGLFWNRWGLLGPVL